jgi:RNA polymerase sigma-70 factor (sigma-E family)
MSKPPAAGSPVRLGKANARAEFEDFFRRHHRELARLAYTMTGNRAESDDVVGEALASAWERWDRVQAADSPQAYVRKIVVNLSVERVRTAVRDRQRHRLMAPLSRWFYNSPDVGGAVDLQAAVLALPPGRRACVVMRHVLDLPEEEVARTLGISLGTVKSQTSKGLAQLRQQLDPGELATAASSARAARTTRKEA